MNQAERETRRRKRILEHGRTPQNGIKTCRYFGVSRSTFYLWRRACQAQGDAGLIKKKPIPHHMPKQTPPEVVEKVLRRRRTCHLGPIRIVWYLERYHAIRTSDAGVYRILRRHGLNRLSRRVGRRAIHRKRYNTQVPGHHVQVDVKCLSFVGKNNSPIKRYQYTAINDATRIRALKVYPRHNQKNARACVEYVLEKFPFRVQSIRTDRRHEFRAKFHWHVEDKGIRHVYIKPRSPQLNGKVERSHRTDQDEFYQLLEYVDDVDLNKKLAEWERFYNLTRPHGAFGGRTPYEALRERLQ